MSREFNKKETFKSRKDSKERKISFSEKEEKNVQR